jgi:hypothetical protein
MVDVAIRDTSEQQSSVFENRDIQAMVASAERANRDRRFGD